MELQTIFTQVIQHLVRQDRPSFLEDEDDVCAYRGGDGAKCAVGYLISDKHYDKVIEHNNLNSEEVVHSLTDTIGELDETKIEVLSALQMVHDFPYSHLMMGIRNDAASPAKVLIHDVEDIAAKYNLIVPRAFYDWLAKYEG